MCELNLQPLPRCGDHQIKLKHCPQPLNYFTTLSHPVAARGENRREGCEIS